MKDAFDLLGLPPLFCLDLSVLEDHYRKAQWAAHPDRCTYGHRLSSDINTAYNTLKNSLERAACLLKRFKKWPIPNNPSILEEIFEYHHRGDTPSENVLSDAYAHLAHCFERKEYEAAQQAYLRLCYLEKLSKGVSH